MENQIEKNSNLTLITLIVSLVTLVLVAYLALFNNTAQIVQDELMAMEAMKVGGMENYELVKKIYNSPEFKTQQTQSLQQAVSQFEGAGTTNPTDTSGATPSPSDQQAGADGFTRGTLTKDQIATVTKDTEFKGEADANIVLIEYSDVECPFCQRHHTSKTVDTVIQQNPDAVKTTYKHFPLSFHPEAQKAAEAIECAGDQDKYFEYKDAAFNAAAANGGKPSREVLLATANELDLNEKEFVECLDSNEKADKVKSDMNEGSSLFGVSGTPGNVLLNTETGKYIVIAGAYPAADFDKVITELKSK